MRDGVSALLRPVSRDQPEARRLGEPEHALVGPVLYLDHHRPEGGRHKRLLSTRQHLVLGAVHIDLDVVGRRQAEAPHEIIEAKGEHALGSHHLTAVEREPVPGDVKCRPDVEARIVQVDEPCRGEDGYALAPTS